MERFVKQVIDSMSVVEKKKTLVVINHIHSLTAQLLLNKISHQEYLEQMRELDEALK